MPAYLPGPISDDFGDLLPALAEAGFLPSAGEYSPDTFGNYWVDVAGARGSMRIVRDRGQYFVTGCPREVLERAGLWRTFGDREEFQDRIVAFVRSVASGENPAGS